MITFAAGVAVGWFLAYMALDWLAEHDRKIEVEKLQIDGIDGDG